MEKHEVLKQLVDMSHYLGDPSRTFAILGEGNTSARIDADTMYVKASGTCLATMGETDFLEVSISRATEILDDMNAGDADVAAALRASLCDPSEKRMPSVETMMHALLYRHYPEYGFIGHTHPVSTNALMCSIHAREAAMGRLCPDHIVVMGHKSVFVPYVDPGLVLAREVRERVARYVEEEGVLPKAMLLENHGLFSLGATAKAVMNITEMAEKMSKILLGAYSAGGPRFMSGADIRRIDTRPDEKYRQNTLGQEK
ncbi:MAG TPA: class II aldolase/adducin family protein [Candidatus Hydrogenedentes bacterium]|nr:class II aldolase/adducin family protein [Candidatus Hydrogenedentota bacterium]HRZ84464.1 class II aldolase/adducin family protein [Candidatus Hydrogenedentota bacterium]